MNNPGMANNTSNHPNLQQQPPLYEYLSQHQANSFGRGIGYWPHTCLPGETQQQSSLTKFQSLSSGTARFTDETHQHDNTSLLSGQSMNNPLSGSVRHGVQQCSSKIVPGNFKTTASSTSAAGVGGTAKGVGNDTALLSPVAAQCPGEMNVGTLMNRFPTSSASFSLASTGAGRGGGAATGENGATNQSGSGSSLGRAMDSTNNNNPSGGATAVTPVASSQSAPFNASTSSLHPPNNHHQHHQLTLSNYQYHALLHDRLTAPLTSSSNPSGPNHSSSFTSSTHSSSGIPNRPAAHPPVTVTSRLGGGVSSNFQSTGAGLLKESSSGAVDVSKGSMRSGTTKVQLINKHLMEADRDILHSLMGGSGSGGGNTNESLVDSTSPPPELLRNLYGEGGAMMTKRNYSPSQFANLCNVVAASNGAMPGSSSAGVGAGSGACGRSSNSSSNCDSEQVPGLLSSMVGVGGAHQGTEKKIPNSIRGEDNISVRLQRIKRWAFREEKIIETLLDTIV